MTAEMVILLITAMFLFGALVMYAYIEPYVIDIIDENEKLKDEKKINRMSIEYDDLKGETA